MLTASLLALVSGLAVAQMPDELDILVAPNSKPNIHLLMSDTSAMNSNGGADACPAGSWWSTRHNNSLGTQRIEWLSAALLGCDGVSGVLPKFYNQVNYSLRTLGNGTDTLRVGWGGSLASLMNASHVQNISAPFGVLGTMGSNYDVVGSLYRGAQYFQTLPPLTNPCVKDFQVLVGRGNINPSSVNFDLNCDPSITMSTNDPIAAAGYLTGCMSFNTVTHTCTDQRTDDMLCAFAGDQPIPTYVIGVQPTAPHQAVLENVAWAGQGEYASAASPQDLLVRLEEIISNILARSQVYFSAPAVQRDGIYSGNYAYASSFKPYPNGVWGGNVKKWCILPNQLPDGTYDPTDLGCIFKVTPADRRTLLTNTNPVDVWTGNNLQDADKGGVGTRIQVAGGNNLGPVTGAPNSPHYPLSIQTWRDGDTGYTTLKPNPWIGAGAWNDEDAWVVASDRANLINRLHGYNWSGVYSGGVWAPTTVAKWPFEDAIHAAPVMFKYSNDCETTPGSCFLVLATNAGKLYFIDTANSKGTVSSILIPAELWKPSDNNKAPLREVNNQPTTEIGHRYYLDGGIRKFHVDSNGDGVINNGETAYLMFGLGRGGSAMYQIPMTTFNGVLSNTNNAVRPLKSMPGTVYEELEETWAAPWFGRVQLSGSGSPASEVAVFPSGHINAFDVPDYGLPNLAPARTTMDSLAAPQSMGCPALTGNWIDCEYGFDALLGMWPDFPDELSFGPYQIPDAIAYRLVFDPSTALDHSASKDVFFIQNGAGKPATAITGHGGQVAASPEGDGWAKGLDGNYRSPWVFDTKIGWRIKTDSGRSAAHPGWKIVNVEYITRTPIYGPTQSCDVDLDGDCENTECAPNGLFLCSVCDLDLDGECEGSHGESTDAPLAGRVHNPTIYIVDAHKWNGAAPNPFYTDPADINNSLLVRITKKCTGPAVGLCIEESPSNPDLKYMTAPVSGELSVYTVADRLNMIVWGDELGQIWAAHARQSPGGTSWEVRRLLTLNTPDTSDPVNGPRFNSKDWRKIFRKLDIVGSTCPGRPVLGIYFGTGNVQRPSANDELTNPAVNNGRDVVGVIWDKLPPTPPAAWTTKTVADLDDVTSTAFIDARATYAAGKHGWFWSLAASERMIRDPFVLDGVAYFKTHASTAMAGQCVAGSGTERVYAVNNCSAKAVADGGDAGGGVGDSVQDRNVWQSTGDIGGDLLVITPQNSPPIVSHGDLSVSSQASLAGQKNRRTMRLLFLRNPRGF